MAEKEPLEDIDNLIIRLQNYDFNGITADIGSYSNSQLISIVCKIEYIHKIITEATNLLLELKLNENIQNNTITGIIPPHPTDIIDLTLIVCECFRMYGKLCTNGQSIQNVIMSYNSMALIHHIRILFNTHSLAIEYFKKLKTNIYDHVYDQKISTKIQCTINVIWQFLVNVSIQNEQNQKMIWDAFKVNLLKIFSDPTRNIPRNVYACVSITYNIFIGQPVESNEMNDAIVTAIIKCFCHQWDNDWLKLIPSDIDPADEHQQREIHYNSFMHLFMEYLLTQYTPFAKFLEFKLEKSYRPLVYNYILLFLSDVFLKSDKPLHIELFTSICTNLKEQSKEFLQNCATNNIDGEANNYISILIQIIATLSWINPKYYYGKLLAEDTDLFVIVCGLLKGLHEIGKALHKNQFTPLDRIQDVVRTPDNDSVIVEHEREISYRLKIFLIQIICNTSFENKKYQDLARETQAFHTIFECTNLDARNPYIKEHSILAIRLLCDKNEQNLGIIKDMAKVGDAVRSDDLSKINLELGTLRINPETTRK